MEKDKLEQLIEMLTSQCSVLADLVSVAERQRQALLDGDQSGVEATTKEQDELLVELHQWEAERLALLNGSSLHGIVLDELIDVAPEEMRATLVGLRDEARALVDELTTLNETNAQLLRQELALVELYMSILSADSGYRIVHRPGARKTPCRRYVAGL